MAGRNALSIKLIKPTGEQAIVGSLKNPMVEMTWMEYEMTHISNLNFFRFFFNRQVVYSAARVIISTFIYLSAVRNILKNHLTPSNLFLTIALNLY